MALQVISSHSWTLRYFDIKAVFLQGRPIFEEKVQQLEKTFAFGSHKVSSSTFTGIEINQHIEPISLNVSRKTQLESLVTQKERLALRRLRRQPTMRSKKYPT